MFLQCDPTLLPEPNHVMLNHLYALSIKVTAWQYCCLSAQHLHMNPLCVNSLLHLGFRTGWWFLARLTDTKRSMWPLSSTSPYNLRAHSQAPYIQRRTTWCPAQLLLRIIGNRTKSFITKNSENLLFFDLLFCQLINTELFFFFV